MKAQRSITPIRGGFIPEYRNVINFCVTNSIAVPSSREQAIANRCLKGLIGVSSSGISGYEMIKFYNTAINYSGSIPVNLGYTGVNWANVNLYQASRINTITQTVKSGYSSDGSTSYIKSGWFPSTSINVTPTNIGIARSYIGADSGNNLEGVAGPTAERVQISPYFSNQTLIALCQDGANYFGSVANGAGRYVWAKNNSIDNVDVYKNGTFLSTVTAGASVAAFTTDEYYELARNYTNISVIDLYFNPNIVKQYEIVFKTTDIDIVGLDQVLTEYLTNIALL